MKGLFRGAAVAAVGLAAFSVATNASAVVLNFPSSGSLITSPTNPGSNGPLGSGGGGVLWNSGDRLDETFLATGLSSTGSSNWQFSMSNFTQAPTVNTFNVLINGTTIGAYSFAATDGNPVNFNLNFNYAPISGPNYTLSLVATSTVAPGFGSWNWFPGGHVTLNPVPEPASLAVLSLGVAAFIRRRRRSA